MPAGRQKNKFDVEAHPGGEPTIIPCARGSTATRDRARHRRFLDGTAFWNHSGIGHALTPEQINGRTSQGISGFRDSIGG